MIDKAIEALKGLTLTNLLVLLVLVLILAPAYLAWRVVNDPDLRNILFSSFRAIEVEGVDCSYIKASEAGVDPHWLVAKDFAFSGRDRWFIGVNSPEEPSPAEVEAYCRTLSEVIVYARERNGLTPKPTFPGNKTP